jgi:polar amino acid transport system permease protein
VTTETRAGDSRPSAPVLGFRERLELFSSRVPWSLKLTVVYVLIAAVLVGAFFVIDFDVAWMREHAWQIIRDGLPLTLVICVSAIVLATVLATLGALARLSKNPISYGVAGFYTSFFRGTPLLVQMFLIYFAVAEVGVRLQQNGQAWGKVLVLTEVQAGVLALGLNYGAYMTEIFRAGIQSVGHGQGEAADALGMSYRTKMRRIILPQAIRVIIPPTGNEFIAMLKDSALVYTIGALELFRLSDLAGRRDFRSLEAYLLAAMVYWVLTGIFSFFQARLERRMGRGYVRGGDTRGGGAPAAPSAGAQPGMVGAEVAPVAGESGVV